jgi:hypothetical protein
MLKTQKTQRVVLQSRIMPYALRLTPCGARRRNSSPNSSLIRSPSASSSGGTRVGAWWLDIRIGEATNRTPQASRTAPSRGRPPRAGPRAACGRALPEHPFRRQRASHSEHGSPGKSLPALSSAARFSTRASMVAKRGCSRERQSDFGRPPARNSRRGRRQGRPEREGSGPPGVSEIGRDRLLVAVDREVVRGQPALLMVVQAPPARDVSPVWFVHFDHARAQVREEHRAKRAREHAREVEYQDAFLVR